MFKKYQFIGILLFIFIVRLITYHFPIRLSYTNTDKRGKISTPIKFKLLSSTNLTSRTTPRRLSSTILFSNTTVHPTTKKSSEILCEEINKTNSQTDNMITNPCEPIHCNVLLRSSAGRLGNRMFMFASAYGLARSQNCRLHVSRAIWRELEAHFQMKTISKQMWLDEEGVKKLIHIPQRHTLCTYFPELLQVNAFQNLELTGYWQSYHYFDAYREEIREFFRARNDTLKRIAQYLNTVVQSICPSCPPLPDTSHDELRQAFRTRLNITWISIHIRRTDFHGSGWVSDDHYIHKAMTFYRKRYHQNDVRFLVASDDRSYCHKLFTHKKFSKKVFILPDQLSSSEDLLTLAFCRHSILTAGTFGFWTAYLAGGDVLHDTKYGLYCSRTEYFPPWFLLIGPYPAKKN